MRLNDKCECGHTREQHNNRIIQPFYPELKYNCCMSKGCGCVRFKKDGKMSM